MWTPEQTREAARRRLKKEKERDEALKARRDEARRVARELVKRIVDEDESVRRIWGFGSTFDDLMPYHEHSDIDLAVEGGDIRAWRIADAAAWPVDWVELDDQDETMVESVRERGVILYER